MSHAHDSIAFWGRRLLVIAGGLSLHVCMRSAPDTRSMSTQWTPISAECTEADVTEWSNTERETIAQIVRTRAQERLPPPPEPSQPQNLADDMAPIAAGPEGMWLARWGAPEDIHSFVRLYDPAFGWSGAIADLHDIAAVDAWTCDAQTCRVDASFEFLSLRTFTFPRDRVGRETWSPITGDQRARQTGIHHNEYNQSTHEVRITWPTGNQSIVDLRMPVVGCAETSVSDRDVTFFCLLRSESGFVRKRIRCEGWR